MFFILRRFLDKTVKTGNLTIIDRRGVPHRFGDGSGTEIRVRITNPSLFWKLVVFPDPSFGEGYLKGDLVMESGSVYDLMDQLAPQIDISRKSGWKYANKIGAMIWRRVRRNTIGRARKHVAHHYDLSGDLFDLFLDYDRQYSCAYFETSGQSLRDAQHAKKRHLAAKLALRPGMRVLDIGSGWGGLALYLAENFDVNVVGVTLSEEQYRYSKQRVSNRGLEKNIEIRLMDYRHVQEKFDRIVSVGMFEHVGQSHFDEFFCKVRDLLDDEGVALLHTIGRPHGPQPTSAWMARYIFPGGFIPALSELAPVIERSNLYLTDLEVLRLHYAETLRRWSRRFADNREKAKAIYDERFCRMWEFYLAASEVSFRHEFLNVFQIQIAGHQTALPQTRNYIYEEEKRLREIDQRSHRPKSVSAS